MERARSLDKIAYKPYIYYTTIWNTQRKHTLWRRAEICRPFWKLHLTCRKCQWAFSNDTDIFRNTTWQLEFTYLKSQCSKFHYSRLPLLQYIWVFEKRETPMHQDNLGRGEGGISKLITIELCGKEFENEGSNPCHKFTGDEFGKIRKISTGSKVVKRY